MAKHTRRRSARSRTLDAFHRHEALDRALMLAEMVDAHLRKHPFIDATPALRTQADRAVEVLSELYQAIGRSDNRGE